MARITKGEQALIPNVGLMMSDSLIKSLTQDELSDRVHYASTLMAKARITDDPTLRRSYSNLASAVLRAPESRDETERHAGDLLTKARLTFSPVDAARLRDQAQKLLDDNPVAPRRQDRLRKALRKAAADGQVAVYDKDGNLVGVCDPGKITELIQPPQPSANDDQAAVGQRDMGTAKAPPAAETPAAGTPDEVAKRRLSGIVVRRPI
ncbi:hypothetical protein GCM10009839_38930 [Catenulispora yoronensis]|uniref:CBS domain-containing protein n=1 Tax=Catenulispora yoronensis TaxID=450799 RepID=A0ABN2UDZ3_9ACTN